MLVWSTNNAAKHYHKLEMFVVGKWAGAPHLGCERRPYIVADGQVRGELPPEHLPPCPRCFGKNEREVN